jgi:hypothetical protein
MTEETETQTKTIPAAVPVSVQAAPSATTAVTNTAAVGTTVGMGVVLMQYFFKLPTDVAVAMCSMLAPFIHAIGRQILNRINRERAPKAT